MRKIRLKRCGRKQQARFIYNAIVHFLELEAQVFFLVI
uniref:Ribosomal protein S16 n=3 Tax=Taiwania TaxID=25613 RepID=R4LC51_9CONI|nr:ribosomal protein S16 [Taiwania flousiana]AGL11234.1 ribosomal protein S16 [Taiwania flousiana]AVR43495.1 ribosomal protein S16 [Taiwania cryptomerioides]